MAQDPLPPRAVETPPGDGPAIEPRHEALIAAVRTEIGRVIVGQQRFIDLLLVALLTRSHALIEGVPGLAKTLAVSTLARTLDGSFARIQFTPDLLPADITGTLVFNPADAAFHVRRGPLFANIILADEINRAPAKVQSALLEAMQERQVSIGGESHPLPEPFLVLATQNPIEHEGTYPLPEAQLDRFMLNIRVDYPSHDEERDILDRSLKDADPAVRAVADMPAVLEIGEAVGRVELHERLREYIVRLMEATRDPAHFGLDEVAPLLEFGASPRAGVFLARACQAYAVVRGRGYVLPEDVKELAPDVLRHRLVLSYEAEAQSVSADEIIGRLLEQVRIP